jgi:hypothetical protein
MAAAVSCALAQPRISPHLDRWGGSAFLVTFRAGADMDRAREALRALGFDLIDHPDLLPLDVVASGPRSAVAVLATWEDVAYVRPAAPALVSRQSVMACAGGLGAAAVAADYTDVGRGWSKRNGTADLQFVIQSVTDKIEEGVAKGEVERALREWEKYANLSFTRANDGSAARTIAVRFAAGAHGDAYPFDGPRGSLAHTFYPAPPNAEPVAGDMHFDASEAWQVGGGIDLYSVALHEAGHALGLGHSDQPGAVMYPYYHQASGLTADDIAGIRELYGDRAGTPPPAPPPTVPTSGSPPATPTPPSTDRTPPSLKIISPATSVAVTTAARFTLSGTASDDTAVAEVRWTSSAGDSGVAAGTTIWTATAPVYVGTTVLTVRAYDAAGNSTWRAITVTRR